MLGNFLAPALPLVAAVTMSAPQQNAQQVFETMQAKQAERWATVDNYAVFQSTMGLVAPIYFEKILVGENKIPAFRFVPPSEYQRPEGQTAEDTRRLGAGMADGYALLGKGLAGQGMPGGLPGMDMSGMFTQMAGVMRMMSTAEENDGRADATQRVGDQAMLARRARLVGRDTVDGREAFVLRADDLSDIDLGEQPKGGKFTLHTATVWIDATEFVMLKMKMEGEAEADGKTMPMALERLDQDYRRVGPMYESHRQVVRLSGLEHLMTPKERKEMEKSRAEMENVKAQLAQMPASQRRLIEGRMKPAMEQLERMTGDGPMLYEAVIEVVSLRVNQGPPGPADVATIFGGTPANPAPSDAGPRRPPETGPDSEPARTDLARFRGVYGAPGQSGAAARRLFVTESCDGRLVAGAMRGDASNWWMTSVSDTEFTMTTSFMSLRLEFAVGSDGTAEAVSHDLEGLTSPLRRLGPLPDDGQRCVPSEQG